MSDAHPGGADRPRSEDPAEGDLSGGHHPHPTAGPEELPVDPDVPASTNARGRAPRVLRDRWDILLVIAAGGALGSLARWAVTTALPHATDGVPWATWLENVTGAFVLGALMVFVLDVWPPSRYVRPFFGVGVLGGYTTFSTYMLDTRTLLSAGQVTTAFGYLLGTLLSGLLAVWLGVLVARTAVTEMERRHRRRREQKSRDPDQTSAAGPNPAGDTDHDPDRTLDPRSRR